MDAMTDIMPDVFTHNSVLNSYDTMRFAWVNWLLWELAGKLWKISGGPKVLFDFPAAPRLGFGWFFSSRNLPKPTQQAGCLIGGFLSWWYIPSRHPSHSPILVLKQPWFWGCPISWNPIKRWEKEAPGWVIKQPGAARQMARSFWVSQWTPRKENGDWCGVLELLSRYRVVFPYPLVNVYIAIENPHFEWTNQL